MTTELADKQQQEGKKSEELTFKCKICGTVKPLSQLREIKRFFPILVACSDCDDRMSYIGKKTK